MSLESESDSSTARDVLQCLGWGLIIGLVALFTQPFWRLAEKPYFKLPHCNNYVTFVSQGPRPEQVGLCTVVSGGNVGLVVLHFDSKGEIKIEMFDSRNPADQDEIALWQRKAKQALQKLLRVRQA